MLYRKEKNKLRNFLRRKYNPEATTSSEYTTACNDSVEELDSSLKEKENTTKKDDNPPKKDEKDDDENEDGDEEDCVLVETQKDTVIYIDCDEIDETIDASQSTKNTEKDELHRNDTTEHFLKNNATLEEGEVRSDNDDITVVGSEIENILKIVQETVEKSRVATPSSSTLTTKTTPRIKSNSRRRKSKRIADIKSFTMVRPSSSSFNSTVTTSELKDLSLSPQRDNNDKLFIVDTVGGFSPLSSIPMYSYDRTVDNNVSSITINDTFDLTAIEDNNDSVIFCGEYMNDEKRVSPSNKRLPNDFITIIDPVIIIFYKFAFFYFHFISSLYVS